MEFGRSGGVRRHGMDHTKRFPRTLEGFGLTWHGGNRFSCFWGNIGNLLHHQIPPNWSSGLQVGPRIFLKAKVPSQELSNKCILQKMTPENKQNHGNWTTSQNRYLLIKWLPFLCLFQLLPAMVYLGAP